MLSYLLKKSLNKSKGKVKESVNYYQPINSTGKAKNKNKGTVSIQFQFPLSYLI
jgi:hypothetical protein